MNEIHHYFSEIKWTGNKGIGTTNYKSYDRDFTIRINNKVNIQGSSDVAFSGDSTKHNPEELLLASISSCHMLWYLHLCSEEGIIVTEYTDNAKGEMIETPNGSGRFDSVTLSPQVTITEETLIEKAKDLHKKANQMCFIANSVNFPVRHHPTINIV